MSAGKYNMIIERRATFRRTFVWKDSLNTPIPLTGYAVVFTIGTRPPLEFTAGVASTDGSLTVTPLQGKIELVIHEETTAEMEWTGLQDWELLLTGPDDVAFRLLAGTVRVV